MTKMRVATGKQRGGRLAVDTEAFASARSPRVDLPAQIGNRGMIELLRRPERTQVLQRLGTPGGVVQLGKFKKKERTYYEFVHQSELGKLKKKRRRDWAKKHKVLEKVLNKKKHGKFLGVLLEGLPKNHGLVSDLIEDKHMTTEAPSTPDYQATETGYEGFNVDAPSDWDILDSVVEKQGKTIVKKGSFKLPVICSTAAEHIIRHRGKSTIPDWNPSEGEVSTGVTVRDDQDKDVAKNFDLGTDELPKSILKKPGVWSNPGTKTFTPSTLNVGEGILAFGASPKGVGDHHAVVVVARNRTNNEIIVVERNAGETTGSTFYMDDRWLMNVYKGPEGFLKETGMDKAFKLVGR
jgi:hypothetical protein